MKNDYQIEDLVRQNEHLVAYRARAKDGSTHTLTRLNLAQGELKVLQDGAFDDAFMRLLSLNHGCFRSLVDGGLDPSDGIPWLATRWWDGDFLSDQITSEDFTAEDIARVKFHCESVIQTFGKVAGALSFDPETIVTTPSLQGDPVTTFGIDYYTWFRDWAHGRPPGSGVDPQEKLQKLIAKLEFHLPPEKKSAAHQPIDLRSPGATEASDSPQILASAQGDSKGGLKVIAAILILGLTSAGLFFWSQQKEEPITLTTPPPTGLLVTEGPVSLTPPPRPSPLTPVPPQAQPPVIPDRQPIVVTPSVKIADAPRVIEAPQEKGRPEFRGEVLTIGAANTATLAASAGDWVVIEGRIASADRSGSFTFHESDLKARLAKGETTHLVDRDISALGKLVSPNELQIEALYDIDVIFVSKDVYTLADEESLRDLSGTEVTLEARVDHFTQTSTGSSLYFVFHENGPGFRAANSPARTRSGIDEAWMRSFVGKTIRVRGKVSTFEQAKGGRGKRLVIRFERKSDIEIVR